MPMNRRRGLKSRSPRGKKKLAKKSRKRYFVESRGRRREVSEAEAFQRVAIGLPVIAVGTAASLAAIQAIQ